jgi:hypothetical protein
MFKLRDGAWYALPDGTPVQCFQQGYGDQPGWVRWLFRTAEGTTVLIGEEGTGRDTLRLSVPTGVPHARALVPCDLVWEDLRPLAAA